MRISDWSSAVCSSELVIAKEVAWQEIHAFSQSIARGHEVGLINERLLGFVQASARKLNDAVDTTLDRHFDYFGLRTLYDRYLLRPPHTPKGLEPPQKFFQTGRAPCREQGGQYV